MAAVSVTPANFKFKGSCKTIPGVFGATMTASDACYRDGADGTWKLLDANVNLEEGTLLGVVSIGAASAAWGHIVLEGPVDIGGTLANGTPYIAGQTGGDIHPASDFSGFTSAWQYHLGYATSTSTLYVKPHKTGAAI